MFDNFKNLFSSNKEADNTDLFSDILDDAENVVDENEFNDDVLRISAKVDLRSVDFYVPGI